MQQLVLKYMRPDWLRITSYLSVITQREVIIILNY